MSEPREPSAEPNDKPLFVSHVTGAEQHAPAVRHEIAELVANMQGGEPEDQAIIDQMIKDQALFRMVSLGVLKRLELMGVDEAVTLTDKLEAIDPAENPFASDMHAVTFDYDEQRARSTDPDEQRQLRKLGSLANAVFAIATVQATSPMAGADSPESEHFIRYGLRTIDEAQHELTPEKHKALTVIFVEAMTAALPPSPE